jgi:hypothetical protein
MFSAEAVAAIRQSTSLLDGLGDWDYIPGVSRNLGETTSVDKQRELLQGTPDMLILKAVSLGPLHGYGILLSIQIQRIVWRFSRLSVSRLVSSLRESWVPQ